MNPDKGTGSESDAKWFVYLVDHHEGPFSQTEVQTKIQSGAVTDRNYVWCEGMADWKPITDVDPLKKLLGAGGTANTGGTPAVSGAQKTITGRRRWLKLGLWVGIPVAIIGGAVGLYFTGKLDQMLHHPALASKVASLQEAARPALMKVADKVPALRKWISPVPALDDVAPEEHAELRAAASSSEGPRAALALSRKDPQAPFFYVASNLPDGAVLDVFVEGVPDTLLNQLGFSSRLKVTIQKNMGQTETVKFADGKPLPRGEYFIYLAEGDTQPDTVKTALAAGTPGSKSAIGQARLPAKFPKAAKISQVRSYFLGGAKDAVYKERLKEFHDKLRAKVAAELAEVKQFASTIDSQLKSTAETFKKVYRAKPTKPQKAAADKTWRAFATKWSQLDRQMAQSFQKWNVQSLEQNYFYGFLYMMTLQAAVAVEKLHIAQGALFGPATADAAQIPTLQTQAETALAALKAKIDLIEKTPPTPSGMPRREGL